MKQTPSAAPPVPFAITVKQFHTVYYPCSRALAVQLVRSGELESFVDRGRRMILFEKAREYVERKAAAGGAIPPEVSAAKSAAGRKGRAIQLEA